MAHSLRLMQEGLKLLRSLLAGQNTNYIILCDLTFLDYNKCEQF